MTSGDWVWVVSTGSYSDYRVLCACPTKKDAERVARKYGSDAGIESLPIVGGEVEKVDVLHLSTTLWDDGAETDTSDRISHCWPFEPWEDVAPLIWRWVRAPMHKNKGGRLDVHGTDHTRVRKVFSDRRAETIAEPAVRMRKEAQGRR